MAKKAKHKAAPTDPVADDMEYQVTRVTEVTPSGEGFELTFENGANVYVDKPNGWTPKPGIARIYGTIGQPIRGVVLNRRIVFYRSAEEEKQRLTELGPVFMVSLSDALWPNRISNQVNNFLTYNREYLQVLAMRMLQDDRIKDPPPELVAHWKLLAGVIDEEINTLEKGKTH